MKMNLLQVEAIIENAKREIRAAGGSTNEHLFNAIVCLDNILELIETEGTLSEDELMERLKA
jgi:hypothetical protein